MKGILVQNIVFNIQSSMKPNISLMIYYLNIGKTLTLFPADLVPPGPDVSLHLLKSRSTHCS